MNFQTSIVRKEKTSFEVKATNILLQTITYNEVMNDNNLEIGA